MPTENNFIFKTMGVKCCGTAALDTKENNPIEDDITTICPIDKIKKLKKLKTIGQGAFGKVIEAEYSLTKEKYAIKITAMNNLKKTITIVREKIILSKFHHPNIISFQQVFKDRNDNTINIVLELAEGGTLKDQIDKENNIDKNTLIFWLIQSCLVLSYLKQKKVIHRDIKPENIFLTKTGLIKFGDFGLSKECKSKNLNKKKTIAGTPYYMAPEIKEGEYDEKVDIYSLGKTIKELMKQNNNYPEKLVQLVNSLIETNPNIRPSIDELLNDEFIIKGMKMFLAHHNYNDSLAHLIMSQINLKNEKYYNNNGYDNFIEDIREKRKMLLTEENYNKYKDEKDSKDLDIIMCIIDKIINENKKNI